MFVRLVKFYKENVARAKQIFHRILDVKRILKSIRKYCKSNQIIQKKRRSCKTTFWLNISMWNAFRNICWSNQTRNDSSNIEHDFNMQKTIINCETYRHTLKHLVRIWTCKQTSRNIKSSYETCVNCKQTKHLVKI